jgi:hypothetical protein
MKVALQRDGKKIFEFDLSEVKPEDKLDEKQFDKP